MEINETSILALLKKSFTSGNYHHEFDLPSSPQDRQSLMAILKNLEEQGFIQILESPAEGYDYYFVDLYPMLFEREQHHSSNI